MRLVAVHPCTKFEVRRPCRSEDMAYGVSALMVLVTLIFDLLTLNSYTNGEPLFRIWARILQLFAVYATDGRTDRQTDGRTLKSKPHCPLPTGGGITIYRYMHRIQQNNCKFNTNCTIICAGIGTRSAAQRMGPQSRGINRLQQEA